MNSKRSIVIFSIVALLLGLFTLAAPSADAYESGPVCEEGTLSGTDCVIEGAPPVAGPSTCPVSATVSQDGSECFSLVPAALSCPTGSTADPNGVECRQPVDLTPGPLTCAEGFGLVDGGCIRFDEPILVCEAGALTGNVCVVQGDPPVNGPATCPVSATVIEEGNECFTRIAGNLACPEGAVPEINTALCRVPIDLVPGPSVCPVGSGLIDSRCILIEPAACAEGSLDAGVCVVVGAAPVNGPSTCPVSATVVFEDDECFTRVFTNPDGSCPDGTTPDPDGATCRRAIELRPGALMCAPGFGIVDGECLQYSEPVCFSGEFDGVACVVDLGPAIPGPPVCPVSATVFSDGPDCFELAPAFFDCPVGSTPDPDGITCRRPIDTQPGPLTCADGFGIINGDCVRYEDPQVGCNEGILLDGGCLVQGEAPVNGPASCPVSATVMQQGNECFRLVDANADCPAGTTADPNGIDCRLPVEPIPGPLQCEEGFGLIDGGCVRYEPAVFMCLGVVVTINMQTGASGRGTSGPDVILGTDGPDVIIARGGNDLICGEDGDDLIIGGAGNDVILTQGGNDTARGGSGNDFISGEAGDDSMRGGSGNDHIRGDEGDDDIRGGVGDDYLHGGKGRDIIRGGANDDQMVGGGGKADICIGGTGTDIANANCELTISVP